MARQIATILSLRDRISSPLVRVSSNVDRVTRDMRQARNQVQRWQKAFVKSMDKIVGSSVKGAAMIGTALGGMAVKTGFEEAMNMEGFKVQLETAVKDTVKAGKLMEDAVNFSNATPFETGEVVEATAKMEMYGLSSVKWLADIADMAGATNKSILQGTEAMADATVGEFERLKEFGLKKDMILAKSAEKYGKNVVFNAKGQVMDQVKLMDVLQEMMRERFEGGAEKLSKTTKGLWSTVTGVTKNALAQITGLNNDGTIEQGSAYTMLKEKIAAVAGKLQEWQADGTLAKIRKNVTKSITKIIASLKRVFNFIKKHKETILNIITGLMGFYAVIKVVKGLSIAMKVFNTIWLLLNGTLALTPIGWIIIGITALIVAAVALWRNADKVKQKWAEFGEKFPMVHEMITAVGRIIKGLLIVAFNLLITTLKLGWATIKSVFEGMFELVNRQLTNVLNFIEGVFTGDWKRAWDALVDMVIAPFETIWKKAKEIFGKVKELFSSDTKIRATIEGTGNEFLAGMPKYAKGGIATKPSIFGEGKDKEIAIPINRSQRSQNLLKQANSLLGKSDNNTNSGTTSKQTQVHNYHFHGDIYDKEDFVNYVGRKLFGRISNEMANSAAL